MSRSREGARRYRVAWWGGMLASATLHVLVFLLWPGAKIVLERVGDAALVFDELDPVRLVRLAAPARPAEASPIPRRPPHIAVGDVAASRLALDMSPVEPLPPRPDVAPPAWRGTPGPPVAEQTGYVPPIARGILPNWRTRPSWNGSVATIRVHVDAAGRPSGVVEFVSATGNRGLDREIASRVRRIQYQPARRNGEPVAAWAEVTFVFCRTGVAATSPAPATLPEDPCSSALVSGTGGG